jgi:hypothetical protein
MEEENLGSDDREFYEKAHKATHPTAQIETLSANIGGEGKGPNPYETEEER